MDLFGLIGLACLNILIFQFVFEHGGVLLALLAIGAIILAGVYLYTTLEPAFPTLSPAAQQQLTAWAGLVFAGVGFGYAADRLWSGIAWLVRGPARKA